MASACPRTGPETTTEHTGKPSGGRGCRIIRQKVTDHAKVPPPLSIRTDSVTRGLPLEPRATYCPTCDRRATYCPTCDRRATYCPTCGPTACRPRHLATARPMNAGSHTARPTTAGPATAPPATGLRYFPWNHGTPQATGNSANKSPPQTVRRIYKAVQSLAMDRHEMDELFGEISTSSESEASGPTFAPTTTPPTPAPAESPPATPSPGLSRRPPGRNISPALRPVEPSEGDHPDNAAGD
ncbi:uncharacterized protein LOC112639975 [Camponotus floridanus]|uniref:uncharacterized protein LOC112639975 n=1 Tax=Camponotus floridanus TaxID=104421 RepID=UPI000DC6BCD5|nr:uncharacterized protein LOC112639975 [Camponotus floridanus]